MNIYFNVSPLPQLRDVEFSSGIEARRYATMQSELSHLRIVETTESSRGSSIEPKNTVSLVQEDRLGKFPYGEPLDRAGDALI